MVAFRSATEDGRPVKPVTYITSFRGLTLTQPISGSFELMPRVNITNDPEVKKKWLTPEYRTAIGKIEAADLERGSNLVFGEFDTDELGGRPPDGFLIAVLSWIDTLLKNAWFIKDHAMQCDAAFLRAEMAEGVSWTKNYLAMFPSFSDGYTYIAREIQMSVDEIKRWGQAEDLVEGYLSEAGSSSTRFMMEKGYTRSGRAMQFVVAARRAPDLAFKIANYCSALETLFTTDSAELAHKLAERVAFFLGERGQNRRDVFATVKSAYNVRSKLVHGDTLKQNQIDVLPALSAECDGALRKILWEIFNSDDLEKIFDVHNDAIEDYFTCLIFGSSPST
jgi:hypothetical protein